MPMPIIAIRLTPADIEYLDRLGKHLGGNRSTAIRYIVLQSRELGAR